MPVTTTLYNPAEPEQDKLEVTLVVEALRVTVGEDILHERPVEGESVVVRETWPEKPVRPVTVSVEVPPAPDRTGTLVGFAANAKSCTV